MDITLADVKKFLEDQKDGDDVKAFLAELVPSTTEITGDQVLKFLGTDDGKIIVQPLVDSRVTEAVKTRDKFWEKERLEPEVKKRVAAEILKLNPKEEPWQAEIRMLKEENEKEKRERAKDQLRRQIVEKASALKVEPFFIESFLPETIEEGELFLKRIADYNKKVSETAVNDMIAAGKFVPSTGKIDNPNRIDRSKLTMEEAVRLEMAGELDG